jgi:hypothetical protein
MTRNLDSDEDSGKRIAIQLALLEEREQQSAKRDAGMKQVQDEILISINKIVTINALSDQRFKSLEDHKLDIEQRVIAIESDKRTLVGFWGALANGILSVGSYLK